MPDISDYVRTLAGAEAKTGSADWPAAAALWAKVVELNPVVHNGLILFRSQADV